MSDEPKQPEPDWLPDGRGQRPTDPNEFAKWLIEQTTGDGDDDDYDAPPPETERPGAGNPPS